MDEEDVAWLRAQMGGENPGQRVDAEIQQIALAHMMKSADGDTFMHDLEPFDARELDREQFESADAMASKALLFPSDAPNRSAFHAVRFAGAKKTDDLNSLAAGEYTLPDGSTATRPTLRALYLNKQREQCMLLNEQCVPKASEVSFIAKTLAAWRESREQGLRGGVRSAALRWRCCQRCV